MDELRHDPHQTWKLLAFAVITGIACVLTIYFVVFTVMKMIYL